MNYINIARILGTILIFFSPAFLAPIAVNYIYQDGEFYPFIFTFLLSLVIGFLLSAPTYHLKKEIRIREGFLVVVLAWLTIGLVSSLPFWLEKDVPLNFLDSLFEGVSGITTTGATILHKIDGLPHDILFYRQELQLLGGMGIIILAVAVLPMLGIGGMQLFRAEMTGIGREHKLTPRIAETAKILWSVYLVLTAACILSFKIFGMTWFDAICYGFTTVSTGGFAPHDASIAFYPSVKIYFVSIFFMLAGSLSFSLHYLVLKKRDLLLYFQDPEAKFYLSLLLFGIIFFSFFLYWHAVHTNFSDDIIAGIYQVVALSTTSGFVSENYAQWPNVLPYLLFYLAILGGCTGSTSSGIKALRILLLNRQGRREINKLIHPRGEFPIKYGDRTLPYEVMFSIWSYIATYLAIFLVFFLVALSLHLDFETAFAGVASCLGNIGPGLGKVAQNFESVNNPSKILFIIAMFLGRLEIFTFLVLLSPSFWRK